MARMNLGNEKQMSTNVATKVILCHRDIFTYIEPKVERIFTPYLSKLSKYLHLICQNKLKTLKDLSSELLW